MRDVEEDPAVRAAPALDDLGVARERHPVARAELEALRVVALHVPLAERVVEAPAFAPHGFGDERPGRLLGHDDPGRVELHELHVHQPAARIERQSHAVAVVLVATRRASAPDAGVTAGREDDRVGEVDRPLAGVEVEGDGAEARAVGDEQARDVLLVLDGDAEFGRLVRDGPQDGAPGVVARVTRAPPAVGAEEALVQPAVFGSGEHTAPGIELADGVGRLAGHDLDHPRIAQEIALAQRVGEVLLPRVLRVARPEGRVDATGSEHGVGVQLRPLAEDARLDAGPRRGDRGAQAGRARADDEDAGGGGSEGRRHDRNLGPTPRRMSIPPPTRSRIEPGQVRDLVLTRRHLDREGERPGRSWCRRAGRAVGT
jgi:hypothetical protein